MGNKISPSQDCAELRSLSVAPKCNKFYESVEITDGVRTDSRICVGLSEIQPLLIQSYQYRADCKKTMESIVNDGIDEIDLFEKHKYLKIHLVHYTVCDPQPKELIEPLIKLETEILEMIFNYCGFTGTSHRTTFLKFYNVKTDGKKKKKKNSQDVCHIYDADDEEDEGINEEQGAELQDLIKKNIGTDPLNDPTNYIVTRVDGSQFIPQDPYFIEKEEL